MLSQTTWDFSRSTLIPDFDMKMRPRWLEGSVVEAQHFLLSWLSETNQQILFVPIFSKQPLEILFATLILGWKAVRGGRAFQKWGQPCVSRDRASYIKGAKVVVEGCKFSCSQYQKRRNVNSVPPERLCFFWQILIRIWLWRLKVFMHSRLYGFEGIWSCQ